jgi:hypothetical protein
MMNDFLNTYEAFGQDDPVRILPVWQNRSPDKHIVSARIVVFIGFPVKCIEEYPLSIHRIHFRT